MGIVAWIVLFVFALRGARWAYAIFVIPRVCVDSGAHRGEEVAPADVVHDTEGERDSV